VDDFCLIVLVKHLFWESSIARILGFYVPWYRFSMVEISWWNISLDLWIHRWSLLCLLKKSNNQMNGLLVPSKPREWQTKFGAKHLPILWAASHKLHNKYEGPNFCPDSWSPTLYPKMKLVTFLHDWGNISPLRFEM
jgi:hypothetical protein